MKIIRIIRLAILVCCASLWGTTGVPAQRPPEIEASILSSMPVAEYSRAPVRVEVRLRDQSFDGDLELIHSADGKPPIIYHQSLKASEFSAAVFDITPCLGSSYFERLDVQLVKDGETIASVNIPWRTALDEEHAPGRYSVQESKASMKEFEASHPQRPTMAQVIVFSSLYLVLTLGCLWIFPKKPDSESVRFLNETNTDVREAEPPARRCLPAEKGRGKVGFGLLLLWVSAVVYSTGAGRETAKDHFYEMTEGDPSYRIVNLYFGNNGPLEINASPGSSVRFPEKSNLNKNIREVTVDLDSGMITVLPMTSGNYGQVILWGRRPKE